MEPLSQQHCRPAQPGESALPTTEVVQLAKQLPEWQMLERGGVRQLERAFQFKNFTQALAFTDEVGRLAEAEDHHPSILTEWGRVTVTLWTHKVNGLHLNDFILAAKVDQLPSPA